MGIKANEIFYEEVISDMLKFCIFLLPIYSGKQDGRERCNHDIIHFLNVPSKFCNNFSYFFVMAKSFFSFLFFIFWLVDARS